MHEDMELEVDESPWKQGASHSQPVASHGKWIKPGTSRGGLPWILLSVFPWIAAGIAVEIATGVAV